MEYEQDFPGSFMERTRKNLEEYKGGSEATHLINSMLGLLIIPTEKHFERTPKTLLNQLDPAEWGNVSGWMTHPYKCDLGHEHTLTLRQFVRKLRNAVAHFDITPYPVQGPVEGFKFKDKSFEASIPVHDLTCFVKQLASELAKP